MMKNTAPLLVVFILTIGCKYNIRDYYTPFEGKVSITKISDSQYNPGGGNNYADIFMDFIPDDPEAPKAYRFKKWKDANVRLSHRSRLNHYKPWIKKSGIKEGNVYPAVRYEKRRFGSATPVIFKVDIERELGNK